jgi:hypothetical protein
VARELSSRFPFGTAHVPHAESAVFPRAGDRFAIGRNGHGMDRSAAALENGDFLRRFVRNVDQTDPTVKRSGTCREHTTVWGEGE